MNIENIKKLQNGDEIFWNDPDTEDNCSRHITIQTITIKGGTVCISGKDGDYLECFAHEIE